MSPQDPVDPASLEQASFALVRRGFDPAAVQSSLRAAAAEIRRLDRLNAELEGRLAEQDALVEDLPDERLEARRVAEALGVEATHVLEAAHDAASERADRADREAQAVRAEAITAADALRAEGQQQREEIIAGATREAEELIEEARTRGRDMVAEAQGVRERMLRDLARKRQTGRAQVEQLRAGRDRLLGSLSTVQDSLDTAIGDLVESVPEARAAAERAGMRIKDEPELTPEQLEAEIEAARLVGHPLVDDLPAPTDDDTFITGEMEALTHVDLALDAVDEPVVESEEPEADHDPEPDPEPEPEPEPEPSPEVDIFAKLREAHDDEDGEDDEAHNDEDDEPEPEPEPELEPEPEPELDPVAEARETAISTAARSLKKVVVDEQGTLLDGVRRSGADAISPVVDAEAAPAPYSDAVRPALLEFAAALGAPIGVEFETALDHVHSLVVQPVHQRLREVAEASGDPDEISDVVRGLYRESRSRRVPEAVDAAVSAAHGLIVLAGAQGQVRWSCATDSVCGPDCADNELQGPIGAGQAFPTGHTHPPAHPTCTCRLVAED